VARRQLQKVQEVGDTNGQGGARSAPNRRAEILEIAASLFAKQGVDRTTVREIGNAAGMLSGSLYHYFESKEAMVTEIVTGYLAHRLEDCRRIEAEFLDPRERLAELLRTELKDIANSAAAQVVNSQSVYVLDLLPGDPELRDLALNVRKIWMDTICSGVKQGVFRSDVDQEIFYALARKTSSNALQMWVGALADGPQLATDRYGAEAVAEAWIKILIQGFETPGSELRRSDGRTAKSRPGSRPAR
jgi:AcrR family transcriptional regulator